MVEKPNEQAMARAKDIMITSLNKGNLVPCINIITHGFPIDAAILDCEINLLMHLAGTGTLDQVN